MFENIEAIMKMRSAWGKFSANHPRFSAFLGEMGKSGTPEGTIIEIHVEYPDGRRLSSNMRVSAADIELIQSLRDLAKK